MVNWQSLEEIQKDGVIFGKLIHSLLGLYIWEWATSLRFDWDFVVGKKTFRWPLTFYFLNRYCLLFSLIGIAVALNVTEEIDCQALYTFNACIGNAAIGLASINLSLRTMAVWAQAWYIVAPLVLVILGHWSLLLHGILVKAAWVPGQGCVIVMTDSKILAATFIYTMAFDFVVLCLTAFKLVFPIGNRSKMVTALLTDGVVYFILAFLANLIATTFMLLNLNPVMSIIFNVPAAIVSTIAATRAVRRLSNFSHQGPEVFGSTTQGSTIAFRSNMGRHKVTTKNGADSVHVQMDTLHNISDRDLGEYDAAGKVVKGDNYDPESQHISDEFKRPPY